MTKLVAVGRGGALDPRRVIAVIRANSAPVKRLLEANATQVINMTYGYPKQTVVLLDTGYLAVISLSIEELLLALSETDAA